MRVYKRRQLIGGLGKFGIGNSHPDKTRISDAIQAMANAGVDKYTFLLLAI